ncbi:hypothetical protein MMYC01_210519 [Madurella mycetomatis]|uniref:Uncharacterized protein n=1 Tax=Madurella mycetomatis TaxID=100816 RepID=A0A175VSG7_9PEZI|nr:hypothetical protein MMYC01_210519 [Madurella mycetomatis]
MATVCLDDQIFCTPPVAAGPKLTSRSALSRNGDLSANVSRAPFHLPPLQDAHDSRRGGPGDSPDDAVLISDSESDCDDSDDGRSETAFLSLEELLAAPHNEMQSNCVAGTDEGIDAPPGASGDDDVKEPWATGGADPDDESVPAQRQQSHSLECSPASSSASPRALHAELDEPVPASRRSLQCAGVPCRQGLGCPRHPNLSTKVYRQPRHAEEPSAKADNPLYHPQAPPGGSSDTGETEQLLNSHSLPRKATCSIETGDSKDCLHPARSGSREGTLCRDEGNKSNSATPEPTPQPPDSQGRIGRQRDIMGDHNTNFKEDHRPAHPPVPDDRGEQNEECSAVPPEVQQSRASTPILSDDDSISELVLAITEPFMQPSASQDRVSFQRDISRRRHCDVDNGEDYRPIVGSNTEYSQDDDFVRPPLRKRRRISASVSTTRGTVSKRQPRLHCTSSGSRQAQDQPNAQSAGEISAAFPARHPHRDLL